MRILDRLLLENLWRCAIDPVVSITSVVRKRVFLFFFSCMLMWPHVTYMIHFNGEFSKKNQNNFLSGSISNMETYFQLFLLIDTSDPHWPVTFQNISDPTHRILHCFSSSFFLFIIYMEAFFPCCGGKIHLYVALYASKLPAHILKGNFFWIWTLPYLLKL